MSVQDQTSMLLFMIRSLKEEGSWCGETHVQKGLYLCQQITWAPFEFKFILYKHGPYSFDLSECLQRLVADDLVQIQTRPPYGPSLALSEEACLLAGKVSSDERLSSSIRFIARKLGRKGVADLERLATAVYVNRKFGSGLPLEERVTILTSLKTHVPAGAARLAFSEVDTIEREASEAVAAVS